MRSLAKPGSVTHYRSGAARPFMLCASLLQTFPSQIRRMLTNLKAKYEKELFPELQVGATRAEPGDGSRSKT